MTKFEPANPEASPDDRAAQAASNPVLRPELFLREQSIYQLIELRRHPIYGVQLFLDSDLQISSSDASYNTAMVSPILGVSHLNQVAILGGGDGGVLGELLANPTTRHNTNLKVDLVDIDERVIALSKEHFAEFSRGGFHDSRANVISGDAFGYIYMMRGLDAVIYDLTMDPIRDDQSRAEFIAEIMHNISISLRPGGILSMQCCSADGVEVPDSPNGELLAAIIDAARRGFVEIKTQRVYVPSYEEMWTFLSARKEHVV